MTSATGTTRKLQRDHGRVTDLFPPPERRPKYELPASEVAFYRENGFARGGRVLDDRQLGALREAVERFWRGENPRMGELYEIDQAWKDDPKKHLFHILGMWLIDESFHDLLWHPAVTVKAAQLLETPRVRFWHDQVFYKPARHPGVVAWHQDYSYWTRATPARHITCNIALDDTTVENGALHYVPGSHRWPLVPKLALLKDMEGVRTVLSPEQQAGFKPVPMIVKAGECTFHHSHTMHGSYGNRTDRPRRTVALNFMHPETRCADGRNPLLYGVPIVPEGEVIAGDYFPVVLG
jgi:hypothetical protein